MSSWKTRVDSQIRRNIVREKIVRAVMKDSERHQSDLGKGAGVDYVSPPAVE